MNDHELMLMHHGIKGQKWGIRRYQNPDGSLTPAGKARHLNPDENRTRAQSNPASTRETVRKMVTEIKAVQRRSGDPYVDPYTEPLVQEWINQASTGDADKAMKTMKAIRRLDVEQKKPNANQKEIENKYTENLMELRMLDI